MRHIPTGTVKLNIFISHADHIDMLHSDAFPGSMKGS